MIRYEQAPPRDHDPERTVSLSVGLGRIRSHTLREKTSRRRRDTTLLTSKNRDLAGYGTTPKSGLNSATFRASFTKNDDDIHFVALFAIVIQTAGINMTPFERPIELGRIDQGTLALERLHARERGRAMKTNLADNWDFGEHLERPIDGVCQRLGVPPLNANPQAI